MSVHIRIKDFRKTLGLTQKEFSTQLGIKQGSYSDLERGKIGVSGVVLKTLIKNYRINPIWLYDGIGEMLLTTSPVDRTFNLTPTFNSDSDKDNNIVYLRPSDLENLLNNLYNPTFYNQLPSFQLPFKEFLTGTYLAFHTPDEGMFPVFRKDDLIFGKTISVNELSIIHLGKSFLFITNDGVIVRRLIDQTPKTVTICGDNKGYTNPITIALNDVKSMHQIVAKLNFNIDQDYSLGSQLNDLRSIINTISNSSNS